MNTILPKKKQRTHKPTKKRFLVEDCDANSYKITKFKSDGWANAEMYKPIPYDLVILKTSEDKQKIGWWSQFNWDGRKVKQSDVIVQWKRRMYEWGP